MEFEVQISAAGNESANRSIGLANRHPVLSKSNPVLSDSQVRINHSCWVETKGRPRGSAVVGKTGSLLANHRHPTFKFQSDWLDLAELRDSLR